MPERTVKRRLKIVMPRSPQMTALRRSRLYYPFLVLMI
jgi:hypothetical protein